MAGSGLHRDLRDAWGGAELFERAVVALHERLQLVHVAILAADLADLRPHRHRDTFRLAIPDELRQLGGALVIRALLFVEVGLGKIHQRRRIDIDVIKPGVQLFLDQRAQRFQLGVRISRVLLRVHLDVVALDEQGSGESLAQRGGGHHRHVLGGPLVGVGDLAARDFADDRAGVESLGRAEDRTPRVVGQDADVHRRRCKRGHVAAAPRHVQLVDRRGTHTFLLPHLPNHPSRVRFLVITSEDGLAHQRVNLVAFLEHELSRLLAAEFRPRVGRSPARHTRARCPRAAWPRARRVCARG